MPKIINAYSDANGSVADSLKSLGQSMFGNGAQQEVYRQTASEKKRKNDNAEPFAQAVRDGDSNAAAYYAARGGHAGVDAANYNLLSRSNHASGVDDPALATAQLGAHEGIGSTAVGQGRQLANARALNDQTTARTLEAAKYARDNTPTTVYDNNKPTIVPQSEAVRGGHAGAPLTTEQMIATSPAFQAGLNGGGQPADTGAPAAPPGYIHPLVQKALGYGQGAVPYQHLQSGAVGQSYDGGKTVDGHPAGPGWVPVTSKEAVGQTQTNEQIHAAGQPLPAAPTAYPQAAQDAAATSGAKSLVQSEMNKTVGFFGGPEIGANTNRARENLTNLANEARSVVLSSPGRAAVQAQRWANAAIPQPGALGMTGANADQQKNAVITFTQHLRSIYQTEAQEAQDRATPPAERAKIVQHMAQLKRIIGAYEAPAGPPQGQQPAAGAPPQAAPAARPRATNPQTGQAVEFDGQAWVPAQ